MASPSSAHSPPYSHSQPPGINNNNMSTNKKRTADGPGAPALKRRKASTLSTASGAAGLAHPLRQTSFPPDDSSALFGSGVRSPSVDVDTLSLVSGSQVSTAAPIKKKRGRKSKAEKAREQTPSVVGGRAATAVSGVSGEGGGRGGKSVAGGAGGGEEGEGDDEGPTEVAATADVRTKEQKEEEHRMRGMLISALSEDQFYRFENWRAANLSKASVRRVRTCPLSSFA
jgi:transcription initiation factor TFIID subunit 11